MRGPFDDAIEAQQEPLLTRAAAAEEQWRRPPGGKPLIRLLQLLETAGYATPAETAVEVAVSEENRVEFRTRAVQFTAAPSGVVPGGGTAAPSRPRRGRTTESAGDRGEGRAAPGIAQMYMAAAEHRAPPTPTGPQWRSLGPWTMPNGQTYGASRVNVSGRVSAIAVDPRDPAHVLCGAANGGVWESRDRGASWAPRTDFAATLDRWRAGFDPRDPRTVYCGTGEGNWWWFLGAGSCAQRMAGPPGRPCALRPSLAQGFYDLIVDPADSRHLLAGTTGGLYVSTDGGVTWTRRRAVTDVVARRWRPLGERRRRSSRRAGRPVAAPQTAARPGPQWRCQAAPGTFDRLAVAIARSNPGVAYAWGSSGGTAYLWRRTGRYLDGRGGTAGREHRTGLVRLVPAPSRPTATHKSTAAPSRSTAATSRARHGHGAISPTKARSGDSIHPDQHAMAFEPGRPDTIYVGNDGGLYRSNDRGINWQHCNNGLVISEFEYLAQDYGSSRWLHWRHAG